MASGDPVVQIVAVMPPGASAASLDTRAGGSTPAESVIVYDFDAAADEFMDYLCKLEGYAGGGLTFTLPWSASTATSGDTTWGIAIRALPDDAEDIDAAHTYVYNTVADTAASASGEVSYPTIAFTDGADMDSWAEGQLAIVRVKRISGGMAGDAELWSLHGLET